MKYQFFLFRLPRVLRVYPEIFTFISLFRLVNARYLEQIANVGVYETAKNRTYVRTSIFCFKISKILQNGTKRKRYPIHALKCSLFLILHFFSLWFLSFFVFFLTLLREGLSFVLIITRGRFINYKSQPRSIEVSQKNLENSRLIFGRLCIKRYTLCNINRSDWREERLALS